jgi:L-alanine-DL-glutamate epimerase-like enolase superfamily enzyme
MYRRRVACGHQHWLYRQPIAISRGVITGQDVIVVTVAEKGVVGRGESSPNRRFDETPEQALHAIEALIPSLEAGLDRVELQQAMTAGAARNAIDCALWDLEAKLTKARVWELAMLPPPRPTLTSQTIGLDSPQNMASIAARAWSPLLKLKLGGDADIECVRAVREAAPAARIVVDANEAWTLAQLQSFAAAAVSCDVELIEQPLRAGNDSQLDGVRTTIPLGADESFHGVELFERTRDRYQVVNIKLDKTGGLTEALRVKAEAQRRGLRIMVGCMGGTSLAMAPAMLLASDAMLVDLDGARLLQTDRSPGLRYDGGIIAPFAADVWG